MTLESYESRRTLELDEIATWDNVSTFEDIVPPEVARIVRTVLRERSVRCPHLRMMGEVWPYCGALVEDEKQVSERPTIFNPAYRHRVDLAELQLYCTDGFSRCINRINPRREESPERL